MLVDNVMTEHKEMVLQVAVEPSLVTQNCAESYSRLGH